MAKPNKSKPKTAPQSTEIISTSFLEGCKNKNELVRRLRTLAEELQDPDVEPSAQLDGLTTKLLQTLRHKDKEVRLQSALCCMEVFYIYAPEPPWDANEISLVFEQFVMQLSNLSHCTGPSQPNYREYFRLLDQLANVQVGVVLVELSRQGDEKALEVLTDLVRTLLNCVHRDHPPEVMNFCAMAIAACVDEFDVNIPSEILDEFLTCLAAGSTVTELALPKDIPTNKLKKDPKARSAKPQTVTLPSMSYACAANVIQKCEDRLAQPVSNMLNGLLNNDSRFTSNLSSEQVYLVIYELHKIAPPVLTTIIGNVTSLLECDDPVRRMRVVKLLGRLFYSQKSDLAMRFRSCFREWIKRNRDVDTEIRKQMVFCLTYCLKNSEAELVREVEDGLLNLLKDSDNNVRNTAVQQICDLCHHNPDNVSKTLLESIGERIESRTKAERRDAVTGLSQIYQKHFTKRILARLAEEEEVDARDILDFFRNHSSENELLEEKFGWIPTVVLKGCHFQDNTDAEMHSRVLQILDEVLLSKSLCPELRAVGLSLILQSCNDAGFDYKKWWVRELNIRSTMQQVLSQYVDAKAKLKKLKDGSAEAIESEAKANAFLHQLSNMNEPSKSPVPIDKLHAHKDQHIFRLLGSISTPTHSEKARARALEELPKRVQSLGSATSLWMKNLVRRVSMGLSLNVEVNHLCLEFAEKAFEEEDYEATMAFLRPVIMMVEAFPTLGSSSDFFDTLVRLFSASRSVSSKKQAKQFYTEIVTTLSNLLAVVAPHAGARDPQMLSDSDLQEQLLRLCTKDGTAEQAASAVHAMAALVDSSTNSKGSNENTLKSQEKAFGPLLKALTSPQRLSLENNRCVAILASLSALAECAPDAFSSHGRAVKAVRFALESVILGRRGLSMLATEDVVVDDTEREDDENIPPSKTGKSLKGRNDTASLACERIAYSINLLVTHVRSVFKPRREPRDRSNDEDENDINSLAHAKVVFSSLSRILQDKGLPPSSRDRHTCRGRLDRARLRQAAAVGLIQLCDSEIRLEMCLDMEGYVSLCGVILDEEKSVRIAVITELVKMLQAQKPYKSAPGLRLLALASFCSDTDALSNAMANGGAAPVGPVTSTMKSAALKCVKNLRIACENVLAQCRSMGRAGEERFENGLKQKLMPDYCVPFALFLLSHRRETPCEDDQETPDFETHYKQLKKRLKLLFEPLIQSLGDEADNISFLLRMMEVVAGYSIGHVGSSDDVKLQKKLQLVCKTGRVVLLKFVKTDVNLRPYPGKIQIPGKYFVKGVVGTPKSATGSSFLDSEQKKSISVKKSIAARETSPKRSSLKKSRSVTPKSIEGNLTENNSESKVQVTFSEDVGDNDNTGFGHDDSFGDDPGSSHFDEDISPPSPKHLKSAVDGISPIVSPSSSKGRQQGATPDTEPSVSGNSHRKKARNSKNVSLPQDDFGLSLSQSEVEKSQSQNLSMATGNISEISGLTPPSSTKKKKASKPLRKVPIALGRLSGSSASVTSRSTRSSVTGRKRKKRNEKKVVQNDDFDFDDQMGVDDKASNEESPPKKLKVRGNKNTKKKANAAASRDEKTKVPPKKAAAAAVSKKKRSVVDGKENRTSTTPPTRPRRTRRAEAR